MNYFLYPHFLRICILFRRFMILLWHYILYNFVRSHLFVAVTNYITNHKRNNNSYYGLVNVGNLEKKYT